MKKSLLALSISTLLFAAASATAVTEEICFETPEGPVCFEEPVPQPMGPGSGGTGGDDEEEVVVKKP